MLPFVYFLPNSMERSRDSQVLQGRIDSEALFLPPHPVPHACVPQATPQGRLIYSSADLPGGEPSTATSQGQRSLCGGCNVSVSVRRTGRRLLHFSQPGSLPTLRAIPSGLWGPHFPPVYTADSRAGPWFTCLCAFYPWG